MQRFERSNVFEIFGPTSLLLHREKRRERNKLGHDALGNLDVFRDCILTIEIEGLRNEKIDRQCQGVSGKHLEYDRTFRGYRGAGSIFDLLQGLDRRRRIFGCECKPQIHALGGTRESMSATAWPPTNRYLTPRALSAPQIRLNETNLGEATPERIASEAVLVRHTPATKRTPPRSLSCFGALRPPGFPATVARFIDQTPLNPP